MRSKAETRRLLRQAMLQCEEEDRSTEYMIQFMQDSCSVNHDCVMSFLKKHGGFKLVSSMTTNKNSNQQSESRRITWTKTLF